jgi:RES domain
LAGFPMSRGPRRKLWRAGKNEFADPWWWCANGDCRFDLDISGQGTLYLGVGQLAGLMEVLGPEITDGEVSEEDLRTRSVFGLDPKLTGTYRIANLVDRRAAGLGVTNELSDMTPYTIPQQWASALYRAGFRGIRYRTRFDTGPDVAGLALFGRAGSNPQRWPVSGRRSAWSLRAQLLAKCRIQTIPTPSIRDLPPAG